MEYKDYYAILGVSKGASQDEIQRAYRKLARQYHPDINQEAGAENRFKDIGEAYEVLKDPEKREQYDRYGSAWKAAQQSGGTPPPGYEDIWVDLSGSPDRSFSGFSGFSSFFEQLFGRGNSRGSAWTDFSTSESGDSQSWTMPGADREAVLSLTLEEAAHGGQREISLIDPETGQSKTYAVKVPKGIRPGQRIRLAKLGGPSMGSGPAGDLYLRVDLQPHAAFRLEGCDLYTTLTVAPWEAALGSEATLTTLDGSVRVKIPAGSSSGRQIRLKGRGFPNPPGGAGDLYAEIEIAVPKVLSDDERRLFEELAERSTFQPRAVEVAR
ncbi:DnaJ C-terminal domain-containing protein [Candidatus Entotheonella palauensis]|uniref:DnaJ C-terminal domain-containing protein n=1 Tax=Candidatus Entotheonella palauensis TaxID=93172 RepID=UPI000B7F8EEE|nr:J domain-containing protein [Candidatus Entotheonella palauensis]